MWAVKGDSNGPMRTVARTSSGDYISEKLLKEYQKDGDVEKLLGSHSPMRARSSSLRGRPPPSTHTSSLRAQSPISISRRPLYSLDAIIANMPKEDQLHRTLNPGNDVYNTGNTGHRNNNKSDVLFQSATAYSKYGITGNPQAPFKADHSMPQSLLESHNNASAATTQSGKSTLGDVKSGTTHRMCRSNSMSRLSRPTNGDLILMSDSHCGPDIRSKDVLDIQLALEESESQRRALMQQQKAAEAALQLQSEQLRKIASSVNDNNVLVESLKLKEKQYHNIFKQLQTSEQEKQVLQGKNMRLQEEMQNRINALDCELRHLKSQHYSTENKNSKNISLLEHTTTALSLMEERNSKLHQEKETLQSEISLLRESFDLSKTRYEVTESDNINLRNESAKLNEVNTTLTRKVQEIAGQMVELHGLLKAVKDENERLIATLQTYAEDKSWTFKQIQEYQDAISHLKTRLSAVSADRDRLFQEKLDLNSKLQQMMFDKEHLMKSQLSLDDQFPELKPQHSSHTELQLDRNGTVKPQGLTSEKKTKEEPSVELAHLKELYKQALEQIAVLDWDKSVLLSQCGSSEQGRIQQQQKESSFSQVSDRMEQQLARDHLASAESDKLVEDLEKLQLQYDNLKHEYNSLVAKQPQRGHDQEVEDKEQELIQMKQEKDAAQKQVAHLQGQMLLLEGSKKRAEEQVCRLTSEVKELQGKLRQLKAQQKEISERPPEEESSSHRQEVEALKLQLEKAKEDQRLQQNFIESLREKTVSDERLELQQLKDKLHELFREVEHKNQAIDSLKLDLKSSRESAEAKQKEVQELYNVIEEVKRENQVLRQDVPVILNSVLAVPQKQQALKQEKSAVPEISSEQTSRNLQDIASNVSIKRDSEAIPSQLMNYSLARNEPSKLFSKTWAPAPRWQINPAGSSSDAAATSKEVDGVSQVKSSKPARKLPPPPPPKPSPVSTSSLSVPVEITTKDMDVVSNAFLASSTEPSSGKWPALSPMSTSTSLSSSGLGQSTFSTDNRDEPQDEGSINTLISKFEEMASF